jgi:tRNA1(Val) A37 N6-methylase TrmN6
MRPEAESGFSEEYTSDSLLDGAITLRQRRRGHRAGTDAVLLAASVTARAGETIVDMGAGTGAVGLIAASRMQDPRGQDARLVLVERDPELARLCAANIAENGMAGRALSVCADALGGPFIAHASVDLVLTNPPFFEEGDAPASPTIGRASAHVMRDGGLALWLAACLRMLRPRGRLALIQRADKLDACLRHLAPMAGSIVVRPVHPRAGADATRVIVTAVKGGRAALRIAAPLILHGEDGRFTQAAEALHRGASLVSPGME